MKTKQQITIQKDTETEDIARVFIQQDRDLAFQLADEIKHQLTASYLKAIREA